MARTIHLRVPERLSEDKKDRLISGIVHQLMLDDAARVADIPAIEAMPEPKYFSAWAI